jgi:hypothetical protein
MATAEEGEGHELVPAADAVPAHQHRIEAWARAAAGAFSPNTVRAWHAHWASWSTWCSQQARSPLPAAPEAVATYLREESAAGLTVGTVRKCMEAIHRLHGIAGLDTGRSCGWRCARSPGERGTAGRQAPGLCNDDAASIRAQVEASGPRSRDVRDLALLLARVSELV